MIILSLLLMIITLMIIESDWTEIFCEYHFYQISVPSMHYERFQKQKGLTDPLKFDSPNKWPQIPF